MEHTISLRMVQTSIRILVVEGEKEHVLVCVIQFWKISLNVALKYIKLHNVMYH